MHHDVAGAVDDAADGRVEVGAGGVVAVRRLTIPR